MSWLLEIEHSPGFKNGRNMQSTIQHHQHLIVFRWASPPLVSTILLLIHPFFPTQTTFLIKRVHSSANDICLHNGQRLKACTATVQKESRKTRDCLFYWHHTKHNSKPQKNRKLCDHFSTPNLPKFCTVHHVSCRLQNPPPPQGSCNTSEWAGCIQSNMKEMARHGGNDVCPYYFSNETS